MGTYLGHDVLHRYLHSFRVGGGMPHVLWCTHFKAHGMKFRKTIAMHHSQSWWHGRFNCAWYAYVDLLDIDYSDGFNCGICKHEVDVVICNGKPLSFRRKFLITASKEETKKAYETLQGSSHAERCLLTSTCRGFLLRYTRGSQNKKGQLLSNEFDTMLSQLDTRVSGIGIPHTRRRWWRIVLL